MKNVKKFFALLLVGVIVTAFAACKAAPAGTENTSTGNEVTVAVTDANGEAVTDKEGKAVTERVPSMAKADLSAEEATATTAKGSKKQESGKTESTTEKKETTTKKVSKIKNPNTVKEIKVSNVTESSLTLSWDGVTCDFYELQYKRREAEKWETIDDKLKATSIDLTGLTSYTDYSFRLRSLIKTKAGLSDSAWTTVDARTKAQDTSRKIKIDVLLPARNSEDDTLLIYVKEDGQKKERLTAEAVKLDGSTFTFETKSKYRGLVTVEARLKTRDESNSVECDKDECTVDLSNIGMDILYGEDDN